MTPSTRQAWRAVSNALNAPSLRALLLYGALALLVFSSIAHDPTHTVIGRGDHVDPRQHMWYLRWSAFVLTGGGDPFFTTHLAYPLGVNLMWNTGMLLPGILLAPVTLTLGPIASYNLLVGLGLVLSSLCAYWVARRYVRTDGAALVGGLLYGFSPYMTIHATVDASLGLAMLPPLVWLLTEDLIIRQERDARRVGALLGVVVGLYLIVSEEIIHMAALLAALAVVGLLAAEPSKWRARVPRLATGTAAALLTTLFVGQVPLWQQLMGTRQTRISPWKPDMIVSDLLDFVVPGPHMLFSSAWSIEWSHRMAGMVTNERTAYMGVPLLLALAWIVVRLRRTPVVVFSAYMGVIVALMSLGRFLRIGGQEYQLFMPWSLLEHVPLGEFALPGRLTVFVYLFAGVILAVGIDHLWRRPGRAARVAAVMMPAAALLPLTPTMPFPNFVPELPPFFTSERLTDVREGSAALVLPIAYHSDDTSMLWQAEAGMRFRMPFGYILTPDATGRGIITPEANTTFRVVRAIDDSGPAAAAAVSPSDRARIAGELRNMNIESVVIGPMANRSTEVELFTAIFGRAPIEVDGVQLWTGLPTLEQLTAAEELAWRNPTAVAYTNLSVKYNQFGRFHDSIAAATEALRLGARPAVAFNNIAASYEALQLWDEAIEAARAALKDDPTYELAKNNLAYAEAQKAKKIANR